MDYMNFCPINQIRNKSDLMKYALENTHKRDSRGGFSSFDYAAAKELYDFFIENVELPDVSSSPEEKIFEKVGAIVSGVVPAAAQV